MKIEPLIRASLLAYIAQWECDRCGQELIPNPENIEKHLDMVLEDEFGLYGTHQGYTLEEALQNSRPEYCDYCEHMITKDD